MDIEQRIKALEERQERQEERLAKHDTQYAVISTKLSAILWGLAVVGTAVISVLVKFVFNF